MFGVVEFTEGAYNFTLADIINKEFSIRPGSTISWFGDPYEANLNITASYRQLTSLGPIFSNQTLINDANLKRKYPVEVLLKLDGPMLSPQINFDIEARNLPTESDGLERASCQSPARTLMRSRQSLMSRN